MGFACAGSGHDSHRTGPCLYGALLGGVQRCRSLRYGRGRRLCGSRGRLVRLRGLFLLRDESAQKLALAEAAAFARRKQADHAVFSVESGLAVDLSRPHALDAFRQQGGYFGQILQGRILQNMRFRTKTADAGRVLGFDFFTGRSDAENFRKHFGQGNE